MIMWSVLLGYFSFFFFFFPLPIVNLDLKFIWRTSSLAISLISDDNRAIVFLPPPPTLQSLVCHEVWLGLACSEVRFKKKGIPITSRWSRNVSYPCFLALRLCAELEDALFILLLFRSTCTQRGGYFTAFYVVLVGKRETSLPVKQQRPCFRLLFFLFCYYPVTWFPNIIAVCVCGKAK